MPTYRLFDGVAGPADVAVDTENYAMGMEFFVTTPASATAILIWRPAVSPGGPVTVGIYSVDDSTGDVGTLIASKAATVPANYGGWFRVDLDAPVALGASAFRSLPAYKVVYHFTTDNFYSATPQYWNSGPGASGQTSGILSAPSGGSGPTEPIGNSGQGTFQAPSSTIGFPTTTFNGTNYWVDVEVDDGGVAPNVPPVANAGADQSVTVGTQVTLSGSSSTDSDGTIASYSWVQSSGPAATLSGTGDTCTFTPSTAGAYVFTLTVTDDDGATHTDSVTVTANAPGNAVPVANAGADQSVESGTTVTLTGSATDSDGTISSLSWSQTSGPAVTLGGSGATRTFTPADAGSYVFTLTATDNLGSVDTDTVTVTVTAPPPPPPPGSAVLWMQTPDGTWYQFGQSASGGSDEAHVFRPETYGAVGDGVTDDTVAIQACIDAAVAAAPQHNYSVEVRLSAKEYAIAGPVGWREQSYGQIHIPQVSASENEPKVTLRITGPVPAQPLLYWDQEQPASAGAVLKSTLAADPAEGGGAVLAGMFTTNGVAVPDDITTFSHMFIVCEDFQVQMPHNLKLGGICLKRIAQAKVDGVAVHSDRYRNSSPSISAGITQVDNFGLWMPEQGNNAWNEIGTFSAMGLYTGVIAQEHITAHSLAFVYGQVGLKIEGNGTGQLWPDGTQKQLVHASWIGMLLNEAVNYWIWNTSAPMQLVVNEFGGEGVTRFDAHVHDPNNMLTGTARFHDIYNQNPVVNGGGRFQIINDNRSRGPVTAPAVPATNLALKNPFWRDATIYLSGGTVTDVRVDGQSVGARTMVRIPSGSTVTLNHSSAPTWSWVLD